MHETPLIAVYRSCAEQIWAQMTADERIAARNGHFPPDLMETAIVTLGFVERPLIRALFAVMARHDDETDALFVNAD